MPQSNKSVISERRKRVAELYLQGWWQTEIAKEVKVTQSQVSQDLSVLRRLWQQSAMVNIDKIKAKELAKIDRLESEYWTAWNKSKTDYQRVISKQIGNKVGEEIRNIHAEKTLQDIILSGDARFLQGIQWCINKRCEIFGINAPKEIDLKSKGESIWPLNITVDSLETSEVLKQLIDASKADPSIPAD